MTAQAIADLFHARSTGRGRWMARCPAHDDSRPSLSIREGRDGRALLYCFGGCALTAILEALDLSIRDLFAGDPPTLAQRMQAARREGTETEQRRQERAERIRRADRAGRLRRVCSSLGEKLARMPEGAEGDALAFLFHSTLTKLRLAEAEVSQ